MLNVVTMIGNKIILHFLTVKKKSARTSPFLWPKKL